MDIAIPIYSVKIKAASGTATLSDVRVYRNNGVTLIGASGAIDITNIGNSSWSRLQTLLSAYDITDGFGFTGVVGGAALELCTVGDTDATEGAIVSFPAGSTIVIGSVPEYAKRTAWGRERVAVSHEQQAISTANLAAVNDALTLNCAGMGQAVFELTSIGTAAPTVVFETSIDGANWKTASGTYQTSSSSPHTSIASGVAAVLSNRYVVNTAGMLQVRCRATVVPAFTGTHTVVGSVSGNPWQSFAAFSSGTAPVTGSNSHDSAAGSSLLQIGVEARSTDGTPVQQGDATRLLSSLVGKGVILPYALPGQLADGMASLATTVASDVIAAPGAGIRLYITSITIASTAPAGTSISIRSATTPRRTIIMPTNDTRTIEFPAPLRLGANEALTALATFASGAVTVSASGYTAAE